MNYEGGKRWKHPHGFEILKKLGIVDRSKNSFSEDDDFSLNEMPLEDLDEDVLFDKDSLLKSGSRQSDYYYKLSRPLKCTHSMYFQMILLSVAFFIVGLCIAIVGPTLPDLQAHTGSVTFSSTVSVVSANAVGVMLGLMFAGVCYRTLNPFCVITLALLTCAISTLVIPWCSTLTSADFVFVAQGVSLGFVLKGVYTLFYTYWKRKYNVFICFYVALAVGATLSPLVTSSFVANQLKYSQITTVSVSQPPSAPRLLSEKSIVKRELSSSNSTFNHSTALDETFDVLNVTTLCLDLVNNCSNSTVTEIISTTPKVKKPIVQDGTFIDPPKYRGDTNQKPQSEQKIPENPPVVVTTRIPTTTLVSTMSVTDKANFSTSPASAATNISANTTSTSKVSSSSINAITIPAVTTPTPEIITTTTIVTSSTKQNTVRTAADVISLNEDSRASTLTPEKFFSKVTPKMNSTTGVKYNNSVLLSLLSVITTVEEFNSTTVFPSTTTSAGRRSYVGDVSKNVWEYMINRVKELNNVRVAYLVVSIISFVSTALFLFTCCCLPCRALRPNVRTNDDDDPLENRVLRVSQLCSHRTNLYAASISWIFCVLTGGVESVMGNLLTAYCVTGMWHEQSSGVLLTTTYWFFVSLSRIAALLFYKRLWQTNCLTLCLACSFVSCGVMVVFSTSWIVLCMCVALIGLTTGHLASMMFCWLDQQLGLAPWFVSVWLCSDQIGRAILTPLTAYGMLHHSPHIMPIVVLICTVVLAVITIGLRKIVQQASHLNAAADHIVNRRHIKSSNGQLLEYRSPTEEADDDIESSEIE